MQGIPGPIASLINLFWGYSGFNIRLYAAFASSLSSLYFGFIGYLFALYWVLIGSLFGISTNQPCRAINRIFLV